MEAKLSHGGVALYDAATHRLVRWLMMSSGTPMSVDLDGDDVTVTFIDGDRAVYDVETGVERSAHHRHPAGSGRNAPAPRASGSRADAGI